MAGDKKITDLDRATPLGSFDFVSATGSDNYKVSYSNLAEYSSIGVQSGTFTESLTISGVAVSTGTSSPPSTEGLIKWTGVPTSATAAGVTGSVAYDSEYFYLNAPNTGVKVLAGASNYRAAYFLNELGDVYGCGFGTSLGLGGGYASVLSPTYITGDVTGVFTTMNFFGNGFFLKDNSDVYGCGENSTGQLGLGYTGVSAGENVNGVIPYPTNITGDVIKVAGGDKHTVFLKSNGDVYTAGGNTYGQLGMGYSGDDNPNLYPIKITGDCIDVGANYSSSILVKSNGEAYGCGRNHEGSIGLGPDSSFASPTLITGGGIVSAYGTDHNTFLLRSDNEVYGAGDTDLLGIGDLGYGFRSTFQHITGNVRSFQAGPTVVTAITPNGDLHAWGNGGNYQFGRGDNRDDLYYPTYLMGSITGALHTYDSTSLLTFTGNALSAGYQSFGSCGVGNTSSQKFFVLSTGTTTYESSWRRTPISTW